MTPLDALYRCQRAWEASQPQLFLTDEMLWPDSGLDETHVPARPCVPGAEAAVRLVEPAPAYRLTAEARGGLNNGAEPRCEQELTATQPLAAPPVSIPPEVGRVGSPNNQTGPDATPAKGARPAQRRSF